MTASATPSPKKLPPKKSGGFGFGRLLLNAVVLLVLLGVFFGIRIRSRNLREKAAAEQASLVQDIHNALGPVKTAIQADAGVKEKLGETLTFGEAGPGELPVDFKMTDRTNVPFVMDVKGDKATGIARGALARDGTNWKILKLEIAAANEVLPVSVAADAPPELQFDVGDGK